MCSDSFAMEDNVSFDLIRHSLNEYILCALAIGEHCWHAQIHSIQQQDQYATQNLV